MARYPWWKEYYARERAQKHDIIVEECRRAHTTIIDREVADVLQHGGICSFPHTRLEDSLEAIIRIVGALYKTGKRKVIALGVLHNAGEDREKKEFSLDGFEHIAKMYAEINGTEPLEMALLPF